MAVVGPPLRRLWSVWRWVALDCSCPGCGWPGALAPPAACPRCRHAPVDYPRDEDELRVIVGERA